MKITFYLDVNDWVSFQRYFRQKKTPLNSVGTPLIIFSSVLMVILNIYYIYYKGPTIIAFISGLTLMILLYLLYARQRSSKQLQQAGLTLKNKHPEAFGDITMEFNDTGIEIQSAKTSKFLTWEEMASFDENNFYFFLYSKKGMAYIIPKRELNSDWIELKTILQKSFAKT